MVSGTWSSEECGARCSEVHIEALHLFLYVEVACGSLFSVWIGLLWNTRRLNRRNPNPS